MVKSVLPDVDVEIQDGGLGLNGGVPSGIHVKIGSCTLAAVGSFFTITKPDQVPEKLGSGPLADACLDSLQLGSQQVIAVVAAASVAGTNGAVAKMGTGTATNAVTGTPNNKYDVIIEILKGGTLNVAQYRFSIDGGDNWSPKKTVPTNGAVEITGTGVTITFTAGVPADGSFVEGDKYTFSTTAPAISNSDFLTALAVVKNNNMSYEFIHVVGQSAPALWAACGAEADTLFQNHVPMFFVMEARNIGAAETIDTYVSALITDAATFTHPRVKVVALRLETASLNGLIRDSNGSGLYCGILSKAKEHESPGKVMSFPVTPAIAIKPNGINDGHIAQLDAARYVTFRRYEGLPGIYVTNGKTMAAPGSDYEYVETLRVANKAARLVRQAALFYAQSEGDKDGINNLKSNMEAPLDNMMGPDTKQIGGYKLTIDPNQDIITTKTLVTELAIFPIPIMRWITIKQRMSNPFRK